MKLITALLMMVALGGMARGSETDEVIELRGRALAGDAKSQAILGWRCLTGEGTPKDPREAFKWARMAAENGSALGQLILGYMYRYGDGVPQNSQEALKWFHLAAENGHVEAQLVLGKIYRKGEIVGRDFAEALKWFRKAAEQDNADAQFEVGYMYAQGEGVAKDEAEAAKWYLRAAEKGVAEAQLNVAIRYDSGRGMPQNSVEAIRWYQAAAEQGIAEAQYNLAYSYAEGSGVPKNTTEALKWYRLSAEQGLPEAQFKLGFMYANGQGVLKDELEALALYSLGALSGLEPAIKARDSLEAKLGPQASLMAQQRSKDLLKKIEAQKARKHAADKPTTDLIDEVPKSSGTGAIVSPSGYILTAAHVVADGTKISVVTVKGTRQATVVQVDESNDVAVLKISGGSFEALPLATSRSVRLGQSVSTIGFPHISIQGFSPKATRGEISSLNGLGDDPRSWQISVPVQSGNSGGPLLDEYGNLVGVVTSKLGLKAAQATGDITQNVNYALKSAYALALLEPYFDSDAREPVKSEERPSFEDMVLRAQKSVVLILVY